MSRFSPSPSFLLSALVLLSGCQTEDILALADHCEGVSALVENGKEICTRGTATRCKQNHTNDDGLRQIDFEGAFRHNRCPRGFTCNSEAHVCELSSTICERGNTMCKGGNIFECSADGKWGETPKEECEYGCSEGTIHSGNNPLTCYECGADEASCAGNTLIVCSNHRLSKTPCDFGCMPTESTAYCRECKDDELKCEKGFIVSCRKDGERAGKWDDDHKQSCENGCFAGARGNEREVSCYECSTDKPKCFSDEKTGGVTIKQCLAHKWYAEDVCEFGCTDSAEAACKLCSQGDKRYYSNNDGYCVEQECKDNQYQDMNTAEVSCKSDLSGLGECLTGRVRCTDNGDGEGTFQFCMNGSWNNFGKCDSDNECKILGENICGEFNDMGHICENNKLIACPNKASCKSDSSGCASCQNGTSKCKDNQVLTCQEGEYQEAECQTGTHCEAKDGKAQCVPHECENGQQRCQDSIIQKCENYKWKAIAACETGEQCQEKDGVAACSCISGTAYCDDATAKNCRDGKWVTTPCGQKACAMKSNEAKCIECESGTKCKDQTELMYCEDNVWSAPTPCSEGMSCIGDEGQAKCACTNGQAKCDSDKTKIVRCQSDGTYGNAESCGADMHCEGVAGSAVCTADPMECSPGARRCKGHDLQTCNAKGKWETQKCEKGCSNMACNDCNDGEYYIVSELDHEIVTNCVNHKWMKTDCYPNLAEERKDLNKAICRGYCTVDGPAYCAGERYRCIDDYAFANDPAYDHSEPVYVLDGSCECDEPGEETRCSPNGRVLQICNHDGEWEDSQQCNLCQDNICYSECYPPKSTQCDGNNVQTCSQDGKWQTQACEFGCNPSTGTCNACKPGSKQCNGNTLKTCSENGEWGNPGQSCSYGCNHEKSACYPECAPGAKQCDDSILKTCNNLGEWDTGTPCPNGCNNLANDCK